MTKKNILNYRYNGLIIALVVLVIVAAFVTPAFFSFKSVSSMLANNAVYGILAVGMMFVLFTGGIDVSVGAVLAVSSVIASKIMVMFHGLPTVTFIVIGVIIGGICGTVNGFLIGKLKIAPLIVTLATMYIFRGTAYVISGGVWTFPHLFTENFKNLSQLRILGFNAIVWWSFVLFVVSGIFLGCFKPGRRLYAVGTSEESAEVAGINSGNVKMMSYILCGAFSGLAGVLYSANYAMSNSDIGSGYEMTAIAICILGGVSITGGKGRIDGVVIAYFLMSVVTYLLSLLKGFSVWQNALQGAIILIAVMVNLLSGHLSDKRMLRERG